MKPDLFTQLGFDQLSDDEKQEMSEQLGEVVLAQIEHRCKPLLSRKHRKAYEKLARTDAVAAFQLLEQCIPNFAAIAQEETARVRRETVDTHAAVMRKLGAG
ncbi:MAG TPA: hypothetical protein VGX69_01755 [Solirubrobacteraceae bacterium]|jgi:hypothetical protein|nr:hypothetical protein [Solirubrobacteraceae bacterium]